MYTAEAASDDYQPSYADEVDRATTTTELQGLPWPAPFSSGRHRNVLLQYAASNVFGVGSPNEFAGNDELLAFAARSTSSFPSRSSPPWPRRRR